MKGDKHFSIEGGKNIFTQRMGGQTFHIGGGGGSDLKKVARMASMLAEPE